MRSKCGRYVERKNVRVPGEVCAARSEKSNQYREVLLNVQKSAEVIVVAYHRVHRRRAESIGVLSMTEKGGMADEGRKH